MREKRSLRIYVPYALLFAAYAVVGALASHPFDDAIYAQNAQFFYFLRIPPFFSLAMGSYYDLANIGGYFFTIVLYLLHVQNVIMIQFGVKIPLIIFSFLTAFVVYKIGREMNFDGKLASLILLTSPIYFFTALVYGSAIILSVFFLVASLLFMLRGKTVISAIFYGMSAGSYLYPLFAIPLLIRYFWVKEGKRNAGMFLLVTSIFAIIGQFTISALYLSKGIYSQSPSTPNGYLAPYSYITFYSPFDFLNILGLAKLLPGDSLDIIYYASALAASIFYFFLPRDKINFDSLLVFIFVQGILFSSLAPFNLPSYMAAEIPLAIILSFAYRKWIFIGLTWLSSLFSFLAMQTINTIGFLIYFVDLNHGIFRINNPSPSWAVQVAGTLYGISILINLLFLRKGEGRKRFSIRKTLAAQSAVVSTIVIVGILVLVPVVGSIPSGMFYAPQVETIQASGSSSFISHENLIVSYDMPLYLQYGSYDRKYINALIQYPPQRSTMYDLNSTSLSQGNASYPLSILYPIAGTEITLYSPYKGNISVSLENATGIIFPSNSSVLGGKKFEYVYNFTQVMEGNYSLVVRSDVQYYSSDSLPSMTLTGFFFVGYMTVNGAEVNGNIPGYLVSNPVSIVFHGIFYRVPPHLPSLTFYVNPDGAQPYYPYVAIGGVTFFAMIIAAAVFLRRV